ncbi:cadherin domain-containing protein [Pirellulaceae bacterium SH467]
MAHIDKWIESFFRLTPPLAPDAVDAIRLEDRILYSATPLPVPQEGEGEVSGGSEYLDAQSYEQLLAEIEEITNSVFLKEQANADATDLEADPNQPSEPILHSREAQVDSESNEEADAVSQTTDNAAPNSSRQEIVFVQDGLYDLDLLLNDLQRDDASADYTIHVLSSVESGLNQIEALLAEYDDLDAIHIVSHGSDGMFQLGSSWIDSENIANYSDRLRSWGMALGPDGDIVIYGCDVAASNEGVQLLDALATFTTADVIASIDKTGTSDNAGNWELEYRTGSIETAIAFSSGFTNLWGGLLDAASTGVAVWAEGGTGNTELESYDGTSFSSEMNGASSGEYRIIDGADSRLRDERIIVGMNSAGVISGQMWNGTTWTSFGFSMGTSSSGVAHGFDVQYETGSDQAVMVWNNGTTSTSGISYSVWDGSTWSSVQTLTSPLSGEARNLHLVSNPNSDEMVLVASNSSSDSYAFVWNGSGWGNSIILENGGGNQTDAYVAYESLSGEAIVVYDAISGGSDLNFRTWNGTSWSSQSTLTSPGTSGDPVYVSLASDPNSDRIALSASTSSNEAWFSVWNGSSWGNETLASDTLVSASGMMASVAFESTSGDLLAVYAENSTSLSVRTWTQGGGWSAEQYTPSLGSSLTPASVALYSDPASNHIMLGVLDSTSDVSFIEWDGGNWGSVTEVETNAGTNSIAHQPYIFLWNSVNDAPTLDSSKSPTLITQSEDSGSPSGAVGTFISSMIDLSSPSGQLDNVTDPDSGGLLGIAVTGANTSQGTWWYTTNGGTTWSALGAVSDSNARLLASDSNTRLYFQPNANYNGTISDAITFRAWDRTSGTNGATVSLYASQNLTVRDDFDTQSYGGNNGTNSWSASWQEIGEADGTAAGSVTVATAGSVVAGPYLSVNMSTANRGISRSVNLSGATSATLSFTYEQMNASAGGQVALQVYNGSTWTTLQTYSVDSSFYSGNVGVYQSFNISSYANSNTAIRFLVTQAASGDNFFIDDIKIDYSVNALAVGGTTPFSTATDTAGLSITAVNDAPVLSPYSPGVSFTEDSAGMTVNVATLLGSTMTDVDSGAVQGIAFTGVSGSGGVLSYSINGGTTWLTTSVNETSALLLRSTDLVRFTPSGDNGGQMLLSYRAWDQTSGTVGSLVNTTTNGGTTAFSSASDTVTVNVSSLNDAPVLDNSGSMTLNSITEDQSTNSGQSVASIVTSAGGDRITDIDSGAVEGIAITTLNSGNGTWQFSINGGTTWSNIGAVSNTSALLLRSTDLVRFIPNGENATTADFSFRAWDRTTGTQGTYVSTATNGGTSAFSTATESAAINVTAVNDAPVAVTDSATAIEAGGISNNTAGTNPTGNVLSNDTDVDLGDTKVVQGVAAGVVASAATNVGSTVTGTFGSITIAANGAYTYTVDNNNTTVQALRSTANTLQDVFTYTVHDSAGLASTTQITVTIQGANDAPYDITSGALSVNENATNATVVGSVTGIDLDSSSHGEALSYALTESAGGRFAIHNSTGQITVADGSLLNRESVAFHSITVRVTDASGASFDKSFQISINDLDEFDISAVSDTNAIANSVAENAANGTLVGITASASDSDATNNTVTYSLLDSAGGRFAIDAATGVVSVANGSLIDYEVAQSHNITIRATSSDSSTNDQVFTIAVNAVNDNDPTITSDGSQSTATVYVAENSSSVTTVTAVDGDAPAQSLTYSIIGGTDASQFTIHSSTGALSFVSAPNFEGPLDQNSDNTYNVIVQVSDGMNTDNQALSVVITDVDEFDVSTPTDTNTAANGVDENVIIGTTVGITANAFDLDSTTNTISYSLTSNPDGLFQIDASTGVVTTAAAINREVHGASRSITVQATSSDGSIATQTFNIVINDLDEFDASTPTDSNAAANEINENVTIGTTVGITANAFDLDSTTNTISYSLTSNPDGLFQIDATTGVVTTAATINREAHGASRSITVQATSSDGSIATQTFNIVINDLDEFDASTPTDSNATANEINENVTIGTTVGITANAFDLDSTTNTISYSLTSNPDGLFQIDAATGVVTTATAINRESHGASRSITVQATSSDGSIATQTFNIGINDLDEFDVSTPTDTDTATNEVNENAVVGTTVGITANAFDLDSTTNTVTYSLTSNPDGLFQIDANTGVVTTAAAINREVHGASRSITVQATSSDGSIASQTFNIGINDLDEFDVSTPTDTDTATNEVNENVTIGTTVGITANAFDLDSTTNTVTYSLTSNPDGLFQIDATTGVVTTAVAINREVHGASRSITVQATSNDGSVATQSFNIGINDLDEFDVSTPTDSNAATNEISENVTIGTTVGITANAFDLDSTTNTITYSLTSNPDGLFQIDANTGVVTTAAAINREVHGASRSITVQATSSDGSIATQTFNIDIQDLDEFDITAISDSNSSANSVSENAANGTIVGITASASDADATTYTVTYTLDNDANGRFTIDAFTGVVMVADGSLLNYEANTSHGVIVRATSADGSFSIQNYSIQLTDVNESTISAIHDADNATDYVLENSTNGTIVGITALATDSDGTDTVTYTLENSANGLFAIDSVTGVITVAGVIDRETTASYNITIRATSSDTSTTILVRSITIGDLDEFDVSTPTDTNAAANEINENVTIGTTVGITANAFDLDSTTNTISYSLTSNPDGLFQIDAATGVVTTATAINRESHGASRSITVQATSSDGSIATQTFNIGINDLDEFDVSTPTDSNAAVNEVNENVAVGSTVGITANAFDFDSTTNTITYSLTSNPDGLFQIDANTGVVTTAAAINREVHGASRSITVQATSSDGSIASQTFNIGINDLDEFDVSTPTDTDTATNEVNENVTIGTTVGITANAFDLDSTTNTATYSLTSNPDGLFQINATTGVVTTAAAINREVHGASRSITVQATSSDGSIATQTFNIGINDLDEFDVSTPTDSNAAVNEVNENVAVGSTVGITANAFDFDSTTNTITYSLTSNPDGLFQIDANTGVVTTAAAINREVHGASRSITVQATSSDGSIASQTFNIGINDLDEFDVSTPTDTDTATNEVNENVTIGTTVGITANAFDLDSTTNTVTYSLTSNPDGLFQIDASTGFVTTAAAINREAHGASRSITVQATSSDGSIATQTLNIGINDLDEFDVSTPTDTNAAANEINENVTIGTTVGITANAFDLDSTTNTISYSLTSNPDGLFQIDAATGVVTTATAINRESHGASRSITVQATSSDGSIATQTFNIGINDLDEFDVSTPTDTDTATNEVNENAVVGTTVGITANAFDLDSTTNTVTYSLTSNPDGLFQIDASTGSVTTAAAINREAHGASRSITVQATSGDGSIATQTFNIGINDLDEFDASTPTDTNVGANEVNENVAVGSAVGITANAFDLDSTTNTIIYSLTNNPDGLFQIDASTGVVTTAAAINREVHGASRSITVQATSSDGSIAAQTFNIGINDLDECDVSTPTDTDTATNEVNENAVVGTTVGITANAFDLDSTTNTVTYSLTSNPDGLFQIDASTGVVTTAAAINREVHGASRSITVQATSSDGSIAAQTFNIGINDLDEFDVSTPTDTDTATNEVNENVTIGTTVGITANAFDLDSTTNTVTYSLTSNPDGLFQIDATTGVVTTAAAINREVHGASRSITVQATSSDGSIAAQTFNIGINDLDEFDVSVPTDTNATVNEVNENVSVGTTVGITANTFDLDSTTNTIIYSLTSNPDGLFQIDATNGIVTTAATINREAHGASRSITVQATSSDGSIATQTFNIGINDLDEFDVSTPTDTDTATNEVNENVTIGTTVGITANAFDLDSTTNTVTYSLTSNPDGLFQIDATTGVVTTAAAINREVHGASRSITVQATSSDGSIAAQTFNIDINDLDEFDVSVPTDADSAMNEVEENSTSGTLVGITVSSIDADATTNSVTYSLDDSAAGRFNIDSVTGVVTVADGSLLNFEAASSHGIVVRATSSDGSYSLQNYTIQLKDENEFAVSSIQDQDASVDFVLENSAVGTTVGIQAVATDPDGTDLVTYSLDNNVGGLFSIDTHTGVITVAGAIDRETAASYSITIRATSSDSSSVTATRTILIGDVDEFNVTAPIDSNSGTNIIAENLQAGSIVGITALAIDSDATTSNVVYSLGNNAGGRFSIDASTGVIRTIQSLNYEFQSSWDVIVIATSMDGSIASSLFTIQVQNVDERPIGRGDVYSTSYLDDLIVPSAGLLLNDWDPDGDSITAILVQAPSRGALLSIAADGSLIYRPERGFVGTVQFAYQVTDGDLVSDVVIVTIQVNRPDSVQNDSTPSSTTSTKSQSESTTTASTATSPTPRDVQQENPSIQKERESDKAQPSAAPIVVNPTTLNGQISMTSERSDSSPGGLSNPISFSRDAVRFFSHGHLHFEVETHRMGDDVDASRFDFAESRRRVENSMNGSQASFDSVLVRTVLGTGAILWLAQGAQFAATLVSAAPAWLHIDPLSVIPKGTETNGKQEKLSEGEKLFER